ncbi:MAG: sugar-binding protein, partial [Eubacteriales bacterium]|nr:sugar-binding protein [Eubacteriales bacterium]
LTLIPVFAVEEGVSYGDVAKSPAVIVIDGEKDAAYDYALKIHQDRLHYENEPETATNGDSYILWDDGFIYVYGEITDATLVPTTEDIQSNQPWMADSLEVFLDVDNDGVDPMQYRIDYTGRPSFQFTDQDSYGGDASAADGIFEYAAKVTDTGYAVEFKIPHASAKIGEKIGLQLQINDMADETIRTCVFPPNSLGGGSWDVTMYDYIVLADAPVIEVPETAAPEAETDAAPATTPAAQTSDAAAVLLFTAAAAAVVLAASKKRR